MPDIYVKHTKFFLGETADVYKPHVNKVRGEIEGAEYIIEIRDRDLPDGTPPSVVVNINLIEWDEAFYLEWDPGGGFATNYDVEVKDPNGNIVADAEGVIQEFIKYQNLPDTFPQNGVEYSFTITTNFFTERLSANPVLGTGSNKTPQNLSQTINQDNESELSWDVVTGDVLGYKVLIKESSSGDLLSEKGVISTNSYVLTSAPKGFLDISVISVSLQKIFESTESNVVNLYNNESITGFDVSLSGTNDFSASWDTVSSADGYNLYRKPPGGSYAKINSSLITINSYSEADVLWKNGDHNFYVVPVASGIEGLTPSEVKTLSVDNIVGIADFTGDDSFSTKAFDASPIEETEDLSNSITHSEQVN